MALIIPIALVALLTVLYYYFTRTFNYWKDKGIIGPAPVPFFGNLYQSALRKKNIGLVFKEIYEAFPNEKVVGVYRMTTPCLLIRDLDIIKHIMIKDFEIFTDRSAEFSKKGLGANLFHADGDTWRVLRNRFTPLFTSGKLKNMLYMIIERGDDFVKYIDEMITNQAEHDVHTLIQKYTTATISACAFGLEVDMENNPDVTQTFKKIDDLIFKMNYTFELSYMYPNLLKKLNMYVVPTCVTKFFNGLVRDVIKQRNGTPSDRKDFMDLILELRQQKEVYGTKRHNDEKQLCLELTDDVIAAQAFIFYAGGYETTATTMSFMLYELAKNPEIQDTLIADIDRVLKKHKGNMTYEMLQDMNYLNKVIDETLRMYPIIEPLIRIALADYKVPGTNLTIKKGTIVLMSALGIQHDEKYYPNPENFDPERHNAENSKDRHACAYMPFGAGPRNCIGLRFAKIQVKVCMVKFFSMFRVEPSTSTPKEAEICPKRIMMGPKNGICLNIVRR